MTRRPIPKQSAPAISVVMTTFNAMPHVVEAVHSVLSQKGPTLELVVVDDGSTDGTLEFLRDHPDRRLRLLDVPRCGRIPALNLAVAQARAPIVANQDADDVSLPGRLAATTAFLDANPEVALVGAAKVVRIDGKGDRLDVLERPTDDLHLRRLLPRANPFFHSSVAYRKAAWQEAGGFDESLPFFEDYDLWLRIAARHGVANLDAELAAKRRHPDQAFDKRHESARGYRVRASIVRRQGPAAAGRLRSWMWATILVGMNRPALQLWRLLRGTSKDKGLTASR